MRPRRPRYRSLPEGLNLVAWFRSRLRFQPEWRELGAELMVGRAFRDHGCPPHSQADWDGWIRAAQLAQRIESDQVQAQIQAMRDRLRRAVSDKTAPVPNPLSKEEPER